MAPNDRVITRLDCIMAKLSCEATNCMMPVHTSSSNCRMFRRSDTSTELSPQNWRSKLTRSSDVTSSPLKPTLYIIWLCTRQICNQPLSTEATLSNVVTHFCALLLWMHLLLPLTKGHFYNVASICWQIGRPYWRGTTVHVVQ